MNTSKLVTKSIIVFCLIFAAAIFVSAQADDRQVEPSYEVSLQLFIGSNDSPQRSEIPANMSVVSKQLKTSFNFTNYRLAGTFLGRIANTGNFEYKSMTNISGQETDLRSQSFLEWSVLSFRNLPTAKNQPGFQAQSFRFGARVPVVTGSVKDETGRAVSTVNYEGIGLTVGRVGFSENTPTLIGTLNLPGANGTIFLVMTVRSVDL